MRLLLFLICLPKKFITSVCLAALIFCTAFGQKVTFDLGIVAGTLIDGRGNKPFENKLILIDRGRIVDIVDAALLKNYICKTLINADAKFIIPGLFDMHSHVTATHITIDTVNSNWQLKVDYDRAAAEWTLRSSLYFGVTTVMELGAFLNEEMQLKQDLEANKIRGPHLFTCGPMIESGKPTFLTMSAVVNTEQEAVAEVQKQADAGVDIITILENVPPNLTKIIIEKGHQNKKKVIGSLRATSGSDGVKFGIDRLTHLPTLFQNSDPPADSIKALLQIMKEQKIANDPTLYFFKCWFQKDSAPAYLERVLPEAIKSGWTQVKAASSKDIANFDFDNFYKGSLNYVKTAYELGVNILAGSNLNVPYTFPGYSLHKELQELSKAGIPNDSLIKIATYKAAEWLGVSDKTGTVEKGKEADIIILNKNPLLNIENTLEIDKVVQHGKVVNRERLLTAVKE